MHSQQPDVTLLLSELTQGNQEVAEKLIPLVYDELKRLVRSYMRRQREDHTLQTTALVHDVPEANSPAMCKLARTLSFLWYRRTVDEANPHRTCPRAFAGETRRSQGRLAPG